jgi:hypothetical protein
MSNDRASDVAVFSHYSRISLPLYARAVERGEPLTDECFESVLDAIDAMG